ncbi:MAG: SbcC/MukB-like Walker B domain-containing protein, partial [Rectinemataceae bacterium]
LEMESTERSLVLEKLFPVGLHERITEIAKTRTQKAQQELSVLNAQIGSLDEEAGEAPEERLASLKAGLEEALASEETARLEAAARALVLEREKERAARAALALEAREALSALLERAAAEAARAARIASARAAAAVAPFIQAFSKARAAAADLASRAATLSADLSASSAETRSIEVKRSRIRECLSLAAAKQKEVFGLQKAMDTWQRRTDALALLAEAEKASKALDLRQAEEAARIGETKANLAGMRMEPGDEALLRAEIDRLQSLDSGLAWLSDQAGRLASLRRDLTASKRSLQDYETSCGQRISERDEVAKVLSGLEATQAHSEALHLAGQLRSGEPCPVCGSRQHPAPASILLDFGAPSQPEIAEIRTRQMELSGEIAGLEASIAHAKERLSEKGSEIEALRFEMENGAASLGIVLPDEGELAEELASLAKKTGESLAASRAQVSRLVARRAEIATLEKTLAERVTAAEALRTQAEGARLDLLRQKTLLEEAERDSGAEDPKPRYEAAARELASIEEERMRLETECSSWERETAELKTKFVTIEREKEAAFVALFEEFGRCANALSHAGFLDGEGASKAAAHMSPAGAPQAAFLLDDGRGGLAEAMVRAEAVLLSQAALAAEEAAAADYREALAAARAKASSLAADLPSPDRAAADLSALEAAASEARAALDLARSRCDPARLSIARLEGTLARRAALEAQRLSLEEGNRGLYRLSELLRGNIAGKQLPFKNFVLAMYFREVTMRASIHLSRMSDGRYYLKPDDGSSRGKIGLGLRVLDAWTGQDRPTGTLSGGEKFLTSISLALGLADSIREQNGGVSLDAVFIDEGFGSLDDEALDRAISVLDLIRGSRVIGIVSHVAALRSRIPACIEVEKTQAGSRLNHSAMFSDQAL